MSGVAVAPTEALSLVSGMTVGFLWAPYLEGSLLPVTPKPRGWT